VWDSEYERSLLGADVPAIINALSIGWYESLFQSYMANKVSCSESEVAQPNIYSFTSLCVWSARWVSYSYVVTLEQYAYLITCDRRAKRRYD
jgi:hypothetical protein